MRLALQILRPLDLRPGHQLVRDEIHAAGDDRRVAALQIGGHRQGSGGKCRLGFIGQERLHRHGAVLYGQILEIEPILLKDLFLIADPQYGMDRRAKAAANRAKAILCLCWRITKAENQHDQRSQQGFFH